MAPSGRGRGAAAGCRVDIPRTGSSVVASGVAKYPRGTAAAPRPTLDGGTTTIPKGQGRG